MLCYNSMGSEMYIGRVEENAMGGPEVDFMCRVISPNQANV
jgi:hypothetical protein